MKKTVYKAALFASLAGFFGHVTAQEIRIEDSKFVHPIMEKWVTEYRKEHPEARFEVKVVSGTEAPSSGLSVVAGRISEEEVNGRVVYTGRYALIPVSNRNNPLIEKAGKGLKKKELRNLVFEKDVLDDEFYEESEKEKYAATVYSRSGQAAITLTLADYFDRAPEQIRGKKIVGDEIYLLHALQKDESGIAFNTLNYVYDLKTRQLKSHLTILPLSLKSDQREALLSENIDKAISLLETAKIETIPVERFGIVIPEEQAGNAEILRFANWILEQGQQYNHEFGFLSLDVRTLSAQKRELNSEGSLTFVK
ncbi:MAG: substrate-binding domain-containing protein [Tannerella sp.]|jgi:ABC-type phosphate transport system substrate-binding protein|nr:substrate-binding domain-containing protein [Tannerella sp.]